MAGSGFGVAVFVLKIGAGLAQGGFEGGFERGEAGIIGRVAFAAGGEYIGQGFFAVDVEE